MTDLTPHPTLIVPSQPLREQHDNIPLELIGLGSTNTLFHIDQAYSVRGVCHRQKMAKRSDFAQKLLDDLRLRKERMTSSQRSNQSHQLPVGKFQWNICSF